MATAAKDQTVTDAQNASVRVEIFDQAYNLRGSDPEYILKLAEYVDSKMRAVAEATNTIDTVRLAVLAAVVGVTAAAQAGKGRRRTAARGSQRRRRARIMSEYYTT